MSILPTRQLFGASVLLGALVLLALAACSATPIAPTPTPLPAPTQPPPTTTPLPRGGNLTMRLEADIPNLRPWQPRTRGEEQLMSLLYSGLTRLDTRLQPQPDLATAWDASPDGRLITFTLRPDVRWHDGQPLTSEDIGYTLSALSTISPTTALLSDLRRIASVTTPTTSTVVISLTERYAPIFSVLSVPILPKHLLIDKDISTLDFWNAPVGSGPFQFQERIPGQSITLRANAAFYRGAPLLDRTVFIIAPDPTVAVDALRQGQLLLAELPWAQGSTISQTVDNVRAGSYVENGYYYLAMNMRENRALADERVRQALAESIDMDALVRDVTAGQGVRIASSALPGSWADDTPVPTTTVDLAAARLLLDEAGWKVPDGGSIRQQNGVTLTLQLFVRSDDARRVRAAELIATAGQQVGIEIVVQRADFATVIRSKYAPPYDFDLLLGSWSNGAGDPSYADLAYYDPDDFALFHSSQINHGVADMRAVLNITGFNDAAYDNQAAAARQLYDFDERNKALALAQGRVAALKPYLFLWADRIPVALNSQVTTLDGPIELNTPMYLWNIERWHFKR
jgi:peptide/nickel transport system substrate-binding protein